MPEAKRRDVGEEDARAVTRARIARYFCALRRVGEDDIRQAFAFRLAAVTASGRPDEAAAARAALIAEREAMLQALRARLAGEEKELAGREVALLKTRRKALRRARRLSVTPASFRAAAGAFTNRRVHTEARPIRPRFPKLQSHPFRRG